MCDARLIYVATISDAVRVVHAFQSKYRLPLSWTLTSDQVTAMAKSVFHDLFPAEEAAELEMRAKLLSGINKWLHKSELTQIEAAKCLGVTQARVSEIKNGKINRFSLSMLVRPAERAGPRPEIRFQKAL